MRRRKKNNEEKGSGKAHWLTTFNDLNTLLLTFFVLIFSMSSIDTDKLMTLRGSLGSALSILKKGEMTSIGVNEPLKSDKSLTPDKGSEDSGAESKEEAIRRLGSTRGVGIDYNEQGAVIKVEDMLLFESGKAEITPKAFPVLDRIAKTIRGTSGPIRVEGHTDNVPISNSNYPSNWELSTERAVNVLKFFMKEGGIRPERLSAVGYGESKPFVPNDSPENRAKNRRVEIVLVDKEK